jgi:hypothetical protein
MFGFNRQAISMGEIYRLDTRDKSRLPLAVMHSVATVRKRRTSVRRAPVSYESRRRRVRIGYVYATS